MNTQFDPIHIDLIPTDSELHVVLSTNPGGRGIASDPLMIPNGDLDGIAFFGKLSRPSLKIVFGEGRFFTSSIALPSNTCVIIGQGVNKTTIQLKDNSDSKLKNRFWPHIRLISDGGAWCLNYGMRDMTLDCNWRGQPWAVTNGNSKIEALHILAVRAKYERIDVVDAGCHGSEAIYGNVGLECFPISLQTCSMGPPYDQYLPEHKHRGEEPASFLEISQCRVLSATFLGGGYCTGIFVVTNQPGAGDRLPKGARTTLAAWVHDNYVEGINGIAFGCAHSEHVLFERNHAVGNRVGFNCDTGRNENIVLRDNRFIGNSHGVNHSPDGGGNVFTFEDNTVLYGPRTTNPITGLPEGYVGLTIGNTINAVAGRNTFIGPSDWADKLFYNYPVHSTDTRLVTGSENVTPGTPPPAPPSDAALAEALQANINLIAERNAAMTQRDQLLVEKTQAESAQNQLRSRLADTYKQAEYAGSKLSVLEDAVQARFAAEDVLRMLNVTK